jgi:hypothetical protein
LFSGLDVNIRDVDFAGHQAGQKGVTGYCKKGIPLLIVLDSFKQNLLSTTTALWM